MTSSRRSLLTSISVCGAASISGCLSIFENGETDPSLANVDESISSSGMFEYDRRNTASVSSESWPTDDVSLDWKFQTDGEVRTSPIVVNGIVYAGGTDNRLYALNAKTGNRLWSFDLSVRVTDSPAVTDGTLIIGGTKIYGLDPATGEQEWSSPEGSRVNSAPTLDDGVAYLARDGGTIYSLDVSTGAVNWTTNVKGRIQSTPAVANGLVYVTTLNGEAIALDADTGEIQWRFAADGVMTTSPTVDSRGVVIATQNGTVFVLDPETGDQRAKIAIGELIAGTVSTNGTHLFLGTLGDKVYAVDLGSESLAWELSTNDSAMSTMVVDDTVIVGDVGGTLYAVTDGSIQWTFNSGEWIGLLPTVADGHIFFGNNDGYVYSIS